MTRARGAVLLASFVGCAPLVGADFDDVTLRERVAQGEDASASTRNTESPPNPIDSAPGPDGGDSDDAGSPAKERVCRGAAITCSAFEDATTCSRQIGCAWTAQTCDGRATGCESSDPTYCYGRGAACTFDFDARRCGPSPTWCSYAADRSACEARDGCSFVGGCSGTPAACDSLPPDRCPAQRGCVALEGR